MKWRLMGLFIFPLFVAVVTVHSCFFCLFRRSQDYMDGSGGTPRSPVSRAFCFIILWCMRGVLDRDHRFAPWQTDRQTDTHTDRQTHTHTQTGVLHLQVFLRESCHVDRDSAERGETE